MFNKLSVFILITLGAATALLYNSDSWTINQQQRLVIHEQDYPQLNSKSRILDLISQVNYAAVVYPQASLTYPNSMFHKYILWNPVESTSYRIKSKVEQTIFGEKHSDIIYYSSGSTLPAYPVFVALCKSEKGYYAPSYFSQGNGFEIPATQEAIEFLKTIDLEHISKSASACQN